MILDRDALKAWSPPPAATDTFVLEARRGTMHKSATGTRLDPVAAQILWTARAELEAEGAVTDSAWCTSCGRHFRDRRSGYVARIARWCPTCPRRRRALPPLRQCAADDCERWFGPTRQNQIFHSNACRKAAQAPVSVPVSYGQ